MRRRCFLLCATTAMALGLGALPASAAEPADQPGGATLKPGRFALDVTLEPSAYGYGYSVRVDGPFAKVEDLPVGLSHVSVNATYALTTGCLSETGKSVRPLEQSHITSAGDHAWTINETPGATWRPGTVEDFGMENPGWYLPESCPAGHTPGIVRWKPISATVQYTYVPQTGEHEYGEPQDGPAIQVKATLKWANAPVPSPV